MVHSIAAQLCQAPPLIAYRKFLEERPKYLVLLIIIIAEITEFTTRGCAYQIIICGSLQDILSMDNCVINPAKAFVQGIIEPLVLLRKMNKLPDGYFVLLFDSVGEAESHKCYSGDTIASFISKHCLKIPSWLKLILTVRTSQLESLSLLPYSRTR